MHKVVLGFSGGLDSTSLLLYHLHAGNSVKTVQFLYGQLHDKEVYAAQRLLDYLMPQFPRQISDFGVIRLPDIFSGSALISNDPDDIPEGHYHQKNMEKTVVPNRNGVFMNILASICIGLQYDKIGIAVHQGDHFIYHDCRPEYIKAMENAIMLSSFPGIKVHCPFLDSDKGKILRAALQWCDELKINFDEIYSRTWTCYKGQELACGKCGSCVERLEAFHTVGRKDPVEYEC